MRSTIRKIARLCLPAAVVAIACQSAATIAGSSPEGTLIANENVHVSIDGQSVVFTDTGSSIEGTITAVITNASADSVAVGRCGNVLLREIAGEWQVVWHSICSLMAQAPEWIAPGASLSVEIEVVSLPPYPQVATWSRPIDGTYRLRIALGGAGGTLPTEISTSNTFTIP